MRDHIHKYIGAVLGGTRVVKRNGKKYIEKVGGYPIFKCVVSGCTHYIARDVVAGRISICWRCGGEMTMNSYTITLKKPHHRECTKGWSETMAS